MPDSDAKADELRAAIAGLEAQRSIQRGKFFELLALSDLTRNRYAPSEEGVRLAELAVSTSQESTDLSESARIRFGAGLINFFKGNLPKAIEYCQIALSLSQRVGDLILQARCLTYLAVAHRRSGEIAGTKAYADLTLALAGQLGMVEYVAMAKANLAWVAWRRENLDDVDLLGREALRLGMKWTIRMVSTGSRFSH